MQLGRALWISLDPLICCLRKLWSYFLRRALELTRDLANFVLALAYLECCTNVHSSLCTVIFILIVTIKFLLARVSPPPPPPPLPCSSWSPSASLWLSSSKPQLFPGEHPKGAGDARHGAASGRIPRRLDDRYLQRPETRCFA